MDQEPSDFLLEDDDQRQHSHSQNLPQNRRQQFHVDGLDNQPDEIQNDDADEDTHSGCSSYQLVNLIDEQTYQKYVENVYPVQVDEIQHI